MDAFKALFADVPSISIVYIRSLLALGKEHDVNLLSTCHELGIDDGALGSPEGAVSINQLLSLLEHADKQLPNKDWALKLGLSWGLNTHGMTSLPLFHRNNPVAIAQLALSNISLRLPFIELTPHLDGDDLLIDFSENWPLAKVRHRVLDMYFGILVRFVTQMGKSVTLCVDTQHAGQGTHLYEIEGCTVKGGHPHNQLIMHDFNDGDFLPASSQTKPERTKQTSQNQQMLLLIRRLITLDPGRSCTIERVAEKLGSTPRTLSRYLRAASLSFSEMRNGVRAQHAQRYLRESTMPIIDIAEKLGYSDQASFSKAFRGWTQQTPGDYRRTHRATEVAEKSVGPSNIKNKKRA
ncbi:MAG: helix-turn-helix transcriptional regulator [Alcanivoracaceae bacterium]|nr:helix-turn-helix transcriptional regulator [Alcanivoracaceae bacterium]